MGIATRRWLVLVSSLLLPTLAAAADDIASLPLGDPARAYQLASGEAGQVVDLASSAPGTPAGVVTFEDMGKALAESDVVLVGEHHANRVVHEAEARILRAIAATGRPFALGMEFFESQDDAALRRFSSGESDATTLLLESGWYDAGGFNFAYYRPLLEIAREHGAPILGLNVPRTVVRTVSRQGIDSLGEAEKALVGELAPPDPRHRFLVDAMMGGFSASMPDMFTGMFAGQRTWDAAMARSIVRAREGVAKDRVVVVIVGVGHVAHGHGIPERLAALAPALRVRVVAPVVAEKPAKHAMVHPGFTPKESATFSRGYADYAYVVTDLGGAEEYPRFGVTLEEVAGEKGLRIAQVEAGSVAARAGVLAGDALLAVNGEPVTSLPRLRLRLADIRWDERVELLVRRAGAELGVPVLVVPATDGPGRWLTSAPRSALLDTFDPKSSQSLVAAEGPATPVPQAKLVHYRDEVVRLDVTDGERLVQSWKLDAAGRPSVGLLARPAADGAVRVELDRDASGVVTAERRYDAKGEPIAKPPAAPQAAAR